jgi:carboxyl-terminal processing protease
VKRILLAVATALVASNSANAQKYIGSQAQDLFDQAAFFLDTQYFGPTTISITDQINKYQLAVDEQCAKEALQCKYETVEPVIAEMFDGLEDPHAYYLTAAAVASQNANRAGTATSPTPRIGITNRTFCDTADGVCTYDDKGNLTSRINGDRLVTSVVKDSPADKAGIKYGDRWVGYDNTTFASFNGNAEALGKFSADFTAKVRSGQPILMQILRGADRQKLDISIQGAVISTSEIPQLELRPDGVGVLRLPDYLITGVGQRVHDLIRDATSRGMKALVFNQRGNGGGSAIERWSTAGALIKNPDPMRRTPRYNADKNTVEEGFANGSFYQRVVSNPVLGNTRSVQNPILFEGPLAVLVDSGCASACEYISSSFQRAKRGLVIGEPTVGIGNTNTQGFPLANGGSASMPTLRSFWTDGTSLPPQIQPDYLATSFDLFKTGVDGGFNKALESIGSKAIAIQPSTTEIQIPFNQPLFTQLNNPLDEVIRQLYQSQRVTTFELISKN